jgi:hypothetical protein
VALAGFLVRRAEGGGTLIRSEMKVMHGAACIISGCAFTAAHGLQGKLQELPYACRCALRGTRQPLHSLALRWLLAVLSPTDQLLRGVHHAGGLRGRLQRDHTHGLLRSNQVGLWAEAVLLPCGLWSGTAPHLRPARPRCCGAQWQRVVCASVWVCVSCSQRAAVSGTAAKCWFEVKGHQHVARCLLCVAAAKKSTTPPSSSPTPCSGWSRAGWLKRVCTDAEGRKDTDRHCLQVCRPAV